MQTLSIRPIGAIRIGEEGPYVELEPPYLPALKGLEYYSHVHILWWFSRRDNPADRGVTQVHPAHGAAPGPMGVFASRSPCRPNPIALSTAEITFVDAGRGRIGLDWTDAEDGTPVVDIKPYSPGLDRVVALMAGCDSLRDVIPFPKVQNSGDLMTDAPNVVDAAQLDDLGIMIAPGTDK